VTAADPADLCVVPGFLTTAEQRRVARVVREIDPGFYVPTLWNGGRMRLRMNCLGRHWSARTYRYDRVRDIDGREAAPIPPTLRRLARRALTATGYWDGRLRDFDVCVVNWYDEADGRLGLHRDDSESAEALASGYPVVSLSVGATAVFEVGGLSRGDAKRDVELASGDLVLFGRSMRLAYHGVRRLRPGTTPAGLGFDGPGRLNLTFRVL
jgi:alkylated DNA repair protein (DNA oxidative demethylase)